jgi:hypothetical protein
MSDVEDRSSRTIVNLRLGPGLLRELDDAASREGIDRSEMSRRLLSDGLARARIRNALEDYADGKRSAWSAAQSAGVSLYEFLDRAHEQGVPYRLDPEVLGRLRGDPEPSPSGPGRDPRQRRRAEETVDRLRQRYRPKTVRALFVGESSPAGGTHFYQANSHLYRAVRSGVGQAFEVADPPEGEAFLDWFRELGFWLVDLADRPVDRMAAAERRRQVGAGVTRLATTIAESRPWRVIAVKSDLDPHIRAAVRAAGVDVDVDVLPFPLYQWRTPFVERLVAILREISASNADPRTRARPAVAETSSSYGAEATLHEAIVNVLRTHPNRWLSAREIANEVARRDLWRRPSDGASPPPSQIRARVGKYPGLFERSSRGIRLRAKRVD